MSSFFRLGAFERAIDSVNKLPPSTTPLMAKLFPSTFRLRVFNHIENSKEIGAVKKFFYSVLSFLGLLDSTINAVATACFNKVTKPDYEKLKKIQIQSGW